MDYITDKLANNEIVLDKYADAVGRTNYLNCVKAAEIEILQRFELVPPIFNIDKKEK